MDLEVEELGRQIHDASSAENRYQRLSRPKDTTSNGDPHLKSRRYGETWVRETSAFAKCRICSRARKNKSRTCQRILVQRS